MTTPVSPKLPAVNNAALDAAANVSATTTTTIQNLQAAPPAVSPTGKPAAPGPMGIAGGLPSGKI